MGFKDAIDVFGGRNRDKSGGLFNLDAIVVVNESHVSKGRLVFAGKSKTLSDDIVDSLGNVFVRASKSEVINLTKEEDFHTTERSRVNSTVVCGAFEV